MSQQELLKIIAICIGLGLILGMLIILSIRLNRRQTLINSLVSPEQLIGLSGTVEIPFDQNSKGKIRVNVRGSLVDIAALSHLSYHYSIGEEVIVIEASENKVRVVPMSYLTDSFDDKN